MGLLPPPPHSVFVLLGSLNCFSKHCDKPVGGNNMRVAYLEATVHPGRDGITAEGTLIVGAKGMAWLDHDKSADIVLSRDQR